LVGCLVVWWLWVCVIFLFGLFLLSLARSFFFFAV